MAFTVAALQAVGLFLVTNTDDSHAARRPNDAPLPHPRRAPSESSSCPSPAGLRDEDMANVAVCAVGGVELVAVFEERLELGC